MQREGEEKIYFNLSPKGEMRMITPLFNFPSEDNQYTIISNNYNLLVHTLPKLIAEGHMTSLAKWLLEFLGIPRKILGIPRNLFLGIPRNS